MVKEPIHRRACEQRVREQPSQLFDVAVGRHHDRALFVTLADHFVEVERLLPGEPTQTEVIDIDIDIVDLRKTGQSSLTCARS